MWSRRQLANTLSIDNKGILHYNGKASETISREITTSAKYGGSITTIKVFIRLKPVGQYRIVGGDTEFLCAINSNGEYKKTV